MINLYMRELENELIKIISQSELPPYCIYLILYKLYVEIKDLAIEQAFLEEGRFLTENNPLKEEQIIISNETIKDLKNKNNLEEKNENGTL